MTEQINPIQIQAMLSSLQQQLYTACANIASKDGVIAVQEEKIKQLEQQLSETNKE